MARSTNRVFKQSKASIDLAFACVLEHRHHPSNDSSEEHFCPTAQAGAFCKAERGKALARHWRQVKENPKKMGVSIYQFKSLTKQTGSSLALTSPFRQFKELPNRIIK